MPIKITPLRFLASLLLIPGLVLPNRARAGDSPRDERGEAPRTLQPVPAVRVHDDQGLRRALTEATPGATIRIAPGTYRGGLWAERLQGDAERPIVIRADDPARPPIIEGAGNGLHLVDPAYVELHDLVIQGASDNGLNIDDGGSFASPAHHVLLRGLVVRDVGPSGNRDGIKLSGLVDFRIESCTVERWGDAGSGIDMVGCHRGLITGCVFRNGDERGSHGVQAKGGSAEVRIQFCRFEHAGRRAAHMGGSTGLAFFRPKPRGYEAKDITFEDCTFIGSMAPVAFVGVDGSVFRHNTIYRPRRFALRILQETREPGFVPCRKGVFTDNIIAFRSDEMRRPVNIGPATAPETFTLARNHWYCLDDPDQSQPRLPITEQDGTYGIDPGFRDAEHGDLRLRENGPARSAGPRLPGNQSKEARS